MTYSRKNGLIGIYKITNLQNGKAYIGQSRNIERRFREHCENNDSAIGQAIQKYGKENFLFEVVESCSVEELDSKEVFYIEHFDTYGEYNLSKGGRGPSFSGKKLNYQDIEEITTLLKGDTLMSEIAEYYDLSLSTLTKINQGETWTQESVQYPIRDPRRDILSLDKEKLIEQIATLGFKKTGELYGKADKTIVYWLEVLELPTKIKDIQKLYGNHISIEASLNGQKLPVSDLEELVDFIEKNELSSASHSAIRSSVKRLYNGGRKSYLGITLVRKED